jgi:tetratricopeptide (TPR) repeat protein
MIDYAFVSGKLGNIIFQEDAQLYLYESDGATVPARSEDVARLFGKYEYQFVEKTALPELKSLLEVSICNNDALFLSTSLLDITLDLSTRLIAAKAVEALFEDSTTLAFVTRRLLSVPMPVEIRSHRQRLMSVLGEFPLSSSLIKETFDAQHVLDQLSFEWGRAVEQVNLNSESEEAARIDLIDSGLFAEIVRAIMSRDELRMNACIVGKAMDPSLKGTIPNALFTDFRSRLGTTFFANEKHKKQRRLKLRSLKEEVVVPSEHSAESLIESLVNQSESTVYTRNVSAYQAKGQVDKQIGAIRDVIYAGKESLAEKYLKELLEFQISRGDRKYAAMSVCALTAIALDANQVEMADQLSRYALQLNPDDDPVVYTTRAEVSKHRGHFQSALKEYEEALDRFPNDRYAMNGYADVLQDLGQWDESLRKYKEVQERFPKDSVAFNGAVGVLRMRGQHRDAVKLAIDNVKSFPEDSVTHSVLAGALTGVGKLDEALRHFRFALDLAPRSTKTIVSYATTLKSAGQIDIAIQLLDASIQKVPDNVSYPNTKANLLRSIGRLDEALAILTDLTRRYPGYSPARFNTAAVYVLQGRSVDAQKLLGSLSEETKLDWNGSRTLALSFLAMGENEEAIQRLRVGMERCPWISERRKYETALGFAEISSKRFVVAAQILQKNMYELSPEQQQPRLLLLSHAQAALGEFGLAETLLNRVFKSRDRQLTDLRSKIISCFQTNPEASGEAIKPNLAIVNQAELNLALAA